MPDLISQTKEDKRKDVAPEWIPVKPEHPEDVVVPEKEISTAEAEQQRERAEKSTSESDQPSFTPPVAATPPPAPARPVPKSPLRKSIETTLSQNINPFYAQMSPELKSSFKQAALETAGKIETMVASGKINVKKIIEWIRDWLKMIPGVNRFFLEQESKIKADHILRQARDQQRRP